MVALAVSGRIVHDGMGSVANDSGGTTVGCRGVPAGRTSFLICFTNVDDFFTVVDNVFTEVLTGSYIPDSSRVMKFPISKSLSLLMYTVLVVVFA